MKRISNICLAALLVFAAGCGGGSSAGPDTKKSEGVMTYAEYDAAAEDAEEAIEAYVQAKQGWWEGTASLYTQDADGAYFVYSMPCTEEEYNKIGAGQKIKVSGYKGAFNGEIEVKDVTAFEIEKGTWTAPAKDVTSLLGTDDLIKSMNQFVSFKGMTIEDSNGSAFLYKWDGSGAEGDDLYFNASLNGKTYTFTVESYLCDQNTDVYKAVKNLKVGDTVDMEGFLYWYEGMNPHITKVTVK